MLLSSLRLEVGGQTADHREGVVLDNLVDTYGLWNHFTGDIA
jgi:hypothetical protein